MNVLITGAAGMLGRCCLEVFADDHAVAGVDLPDGDLSEPGVAGSLVASHAPEWVVHAAAWVDVDGAESHEDRVRAANAVATAEVAGACERAGCGLTYISTDYVFPGDEPGGYAEDAPRRPLGVYGSTKAEGEEAVERISTPWQILRTSWLFGPGPRNFVLTIRRLLAEGRDPRVVTDQFGRPTYAPDLAMIVRHLVENGTPGFFHGTNAGDCSWHDFAREVAVLSGADPDRIGACTAAEYPTPARRPAHSILLSANLERTGCPPRRHWRDALVDYIARLGDDPQAGAKGGSS